MIQNLRASTRASFDHSIPLDPPNHTQTKKSGFQQSPPIRPDQVYQRNPTRTKSGFLNSTKRWFYAYLQTTHNKQQAHNREADHQQDCARRRAQVARVDARKFLSFDSFGPTQPHPNTHNKKERHSGKSKNRPKGVERKPLITKSEFTKECLADLAKHNFDPPKQRFVPDVAGSARPLRTASV